MLSSSMSYSPPMGETYVGLRSALDHRLGTVPHCRLLKLYLLNHVPSGDTRRMGKHELAQC